jgi:hypothetical protein
MTVSVALVFVGVALWKPWSPAGAPAASPALARTAESPVPLAGTGADSGLFADPALQIIDGLDWAGGYEDPHHLWGIAIAYLPFGQLDDALLLRHSAIAPTVRWLKVDPVRDPLGPSSRGPLAGVQGQPVVALAVTWPSSVQPVSEQLEYLGPLAAGSATARPMPLDAAVPALVDLGAPGPVSGTFVLPSGTRARRVVDWLAAGWPAGRYRFDLGLAHGHWTVSFRLDSGN